jgi:hypothetical protein
VNPYPLAYFELIGGIILAAILLTLFALRSRMPLVPRIASLRIAVSKRVRLTALMLSCGGGVVFALMLLADWSFYVPSLNTQWVWYIPNLFTTVFSYLGDSSAQQGYIGSDAVVVVTLTTLGLVVYRLRDNLGSAIRWAFEIFAFPAVIVLTVGIYVTSPIQMPLYVTTFSSGWMINGVPILSNWSVLIASTVFLAVLLISELRSQISKMTEPIVGKQARETECRPRVS